MQQKVDLGNAVLKGVSRSFYLTIRLLPRLMREPVSVGYLLARASDTIADTEAVPAELRKECLSIFHQSLKDEDTREKLCELLEEKFIEHQDNEREKLLLTRIADVFDWYDTVTEQDWIAISDVMKPILQGQVWDVDFFAIQKEKQIDSEEDLENYCYQVAGSVGEFWGVVGKNSDHRYSEYDVEQLKANGTKYGKGLQLVNILRDLPADLENGRCYLPGVDTEDTKAVMKASKYWREKARQYLEIGLTYSSTLRQKRAKIATALPAIIGLKTLDLLDGATWEQWKDGIKISRKEIYKSLLQAVFH
ncbi:MAG: farnesyl-diphosphate farnesyltransferase [Cryomorphaceae bacterium]|jgi:farnesyl-diphosphate farnesyltransferase